MSFQFIQPTEEQKSEMQVYRDRFESLANDIQSSLPASRGKSLSITKLEEAAFWLNKAITGNDK